jgi:AcrR family transcriptional regulator
MRPKISNSEPKSPDRSAETRLRLIEAALDLFGMQGFDGTTTRQLAERAKVNLAAIPYHFGSKDKLYQAVAGHIVERVRERVVAGLAEAEAHVTSRPAARAALHQALERLVEALTAVEADRWARFIMRELMAPSAAFEIFYQGVVEPVQTRICALIEAASGRRHPAQTLRVQGIMLFGQVAIFRFAQPAIRRRLDCTAIGLEELARIKALLRFNLDAILDAGGSP